MNRPELWTYDNQTNRIVNPTGRIMYYWNDPRFGGVQDRFSNAPALPCGKLRPIAGKDRVLSKLKIQLGLACNTNCRYCMQAPWRQAGEEPQPSEAEIDRFLDSLSEAGIRLRPKGRIEIWGGEPLVYIRTLRILLPKLRERFGRECVISLFTNGLLLTRETADLLLTHRVTVRISHDGPGQSLRGVDPIEDPKIFEVWKHLFAESRRAGNPLEFHAVITPMNADLERVVDFFREKFGSEAEVGFEGVVSQTGACAEDCGFTEESARVLSASVFNAAMNRSIPDLMPFIDELLGRMVHRVPASRLGIRCEAGSRSVLTVDLKGRIGSCQNRPVGRFPVGTVKDLEHASNPHLTHWSLRPNCRDCLVLHSCKGGCPHLSDSEAQAACTNEFVFHSAVFASVWHLLTERIITGVEEIPEANSETVEEGRTLHA